MRSSPARTRSIYLLPAILALAACVGERGGDPGPTKPSPTPATVPTPVAGPGTCEATADKLVELSNLEGKQIGREWPQAKQDKKRREFLERCRKELPEGKFTRDTLLCVEASKVLSEAQQCLLAATR